jgi:hypothetical protein
MAPYQNRLGELSVVERQGNNAASLTPLYLACLIAPSLLCIMMVRGYCSVLSHQVVPGQLGPSAAAIG